ncbi:MAG: hypothetical protein ACK4K0_06680 [Flavobacteriales bacterium]
MKAKNKPPLQFLFYASLILLLLVAFFIQTAFSHFPVNENKIVAAYLINAVMAFAIFFIIDRLKKTSPGILGFVFMGGSGLKFLVFFAVFYPFYSADGTISKIEFLSFFVPYSLCLIVEVIFLSKLLKN